MVNSSGGWVVQYTYNAWGEIITSSGSMADISPLRYRGYYYDTETGFYYLQSRYYDPITHRFINADSYVSTGQGIVGTNMFAYCNNNSVIGIDSSGMSNENISVGKTKNVSPEMILFGVAAGIAVGYMIHKLIRSNSKAPNMTLDELFEHQGKTHLLESSNALTGIASEYENFQCQEAKDAMVAELAKNNLHGIVITIQY